MNDSVTAAAGAATDVTVAAGAAAANATTATADLYLIQSYALQRNKSINKLVLRQGARGAEGVYGCHISVIASSEVRCCQEKLLAALGGGGGG